MVQCVMIPEGFVRSDEVEAFVFSVSDGRSSSFDHSYPDAVTKTLHTQGRDKCSESVRQSLKVCRHHTCLTCPCPHLFALVEPDLICVDGCVDLRFGSLQLQDSMFLTVRSRTETSPTKHQLISHMFLQCGHPKPPQRWGTATKVIIISTIIIIIIRRD